VSADQGRWFKLWVSALNDPDLRNLPIEDFGRWCIFGAYLKLHGHDGRITLREPALALQELLRLPSFEAVVKILASFPNCNATPVTTASVTVDIEWLNWQRYQGDYCGDRVRRYRDKKRTLSNGPILDSVTGIEEKRREEKRRDKKRRRGNHVVLSDDQFLDSLRSNPAYKGLDIDTEMGKLDAWLLTPRGVGKKKTRGRVVAWLNRADKPMAAGAAADPYAKFPRYK